MGIIASRNLEEQRREKDGIVYFDRGTITGQSGRRYDRFAIKTHFVQPGESQAERLAMLDTVSRFPARKRCALLPWTTLAEALQAGER